MFTFIAKRMTLFIFFFFGKMFKGFLTTSFNYSDKLANLLENSNIL